MNNDLDEHTYIVVGGSFGIGRALVLELIERNATVHVWSCSIPHEFDNLSIIHSVVDITNDIKDVDLPERLNGLVYCPGSIQLGQLKRLSLDIFREDASASRHPLQRIGAAKDIAAGAQYLRSPESDWVTGHGLHIDGGISSLS